MKPTPPKYAHHFFKWFCHPKLVKYIEGDLLEMYEETRESGGKAKADLKFILDVILLFRPSIIRPAEGTERLNTYGMYKNYIKVGWRNLAKEKGYAFINMGGLALGMSVSMLIALWIWDELSYDKHLPNYDRVAAVMQNLTYGSEVETMSSQSLQLGAELRNTYGNNFKHVVMTSFPQSPILSYKENAITKTGCFMEADGPEVLSVQMVQGSRKALVDLNSILLSESTAIALFGNGKNGVGEVLKIDNRFDVTVAGIYKDLPTNSSFSETQFIAPLDLIVRRGDRNLGWVNNWLEVIVELEEGVDMTSASLAIRDAKIKNVDAGLAKFKPELFLFPLSRWRLHSGFENGINIGGRIEYVILFGAIGGIVLLLACINFTNLCTARAENRAKEVGVRKVVGSRRGQLIAQFFAESFLMVFIAFVFAIVLTQLALPLFNTVAGKNITIDYLNYNLWLACLVIVFGTALLAGSYPSFYLSKFTPGKVLKGTVRAGRFSSLPRKILVVFQFAASVVLIVGTIVIYQQVQFAKNRPLGYTQNGLLFVPMKTQDVRQNFAAFKNELLSAGIASEVSESECMVTNMYWSDGGFQWKDKDPNMQDIIYRGAVDYEFGKTVNWKIKEGRDFSRAFPSDSSAMILNEAAVAYMGLKEPIGEIVRRYGRDYTVVGVVEDMVSQSLYQPASQTYYILDAFNFSQYINIKLDPRLSLNESLVAIERVFRKINPGTPFEYQFADEQVADKFNYESQVGNLVGIFATLAIVISCLGLFGLAAFVAAQRSKEIGIRKIVGASVASLWKLLSKDFLVIVAVACAIAVPVAYALMNSWLQQYHYRTTISVWVLVATCVGAIAITIGTVSYQSLKAAMVNPVKSLRSE